MESKKISVFKGLLENVNFADKPVEYAESMSNLDVDNPLGQLTLRDGSYKKYSDAYGSIVSIFEYKYPTTGETITILNDGGTIEWYKDGVKQTELTPPGGSSISSSFRNNYFGNLDYMLITTGNAATNHLLWYGYTQRLAANNDGLFNDTVVDSGTYRFLKAQMVFEYGLLSNIHNIVYLDGYYYVSHGNGYNQTSSFQGAKMPSRYIEKRDLYFRLVERFCPDEDIPDNTLLSLSVNTLSSCIFIGAGSTIYRMRNDKVITHEKDLGGSDICAICSDASYVYITTGDHLYKRAVNDLSTPGGTADTATSVSECYAIAVPVAGNYFYCSYKSGASNTDNVVQQRLISDLSLNGSSASLYTSTSDIRYFHIDNDGSVPANSKLYAIGGDLNLANLYTLVAATLTVVGSPSDYFDSLVLVGGTTWRGINRCGFVTALDSHETPLYSDWLGVRARSTGISNGVLMDAGTYFYRFSLVDTDGVEYALSDPIYMIHNSVDPHEYNTFLNIGLNIAKITSGDIYRLKYVNLYRAYSDELDALVPSTSYKLLETFDVNESGWNRVSIVSGTLVEDENDYYLNGYGDRTNEEYINDKTYQENSGISENTKPRYVNPKYLLWLDNQLHVANFYCDGDTFPNRVIRSPINAPTNIAFYDYYDFGGAGYEINGLTDAYGRSIALKTIEYGIFYNGILEYRGNIGSSSENSFCKNGDDIYLGNETGIYLLRGHEKERISQPIEVSWKALSDYTGIVLFYNPERDRLYISIPETKAWVHNINYKTWVPYDEYAAFKKLFIDGDKKFLGIKDDILGGAGEYIYVIDEGKDGRNTSQIGGTQASFSYISGLIKLSSGVGENVTLYELNRRAYWLALGGYEVNLKVYSYNPTVSGKDTIFNKNIIAPVDVYQSNQTEYFDGGFGESFNFELSGTVQSLKWNEIEFVFDKIGRIYA